MKTIQLQVAVTLGDDASRVLVELFRDALNAGVHFDEKQDARLRASRNAPFAGNKPPEDQGLLLNSRETAKLLKVSPKTVYTMQKEGRMPSPIRIGTAVRWSYEALRRWVDEGCPRVNVEGGT